jgi:hypothetical protein
MVSKPLRMKINPSSSGVTSTYQPTTNDVESSLEPSVRRFILIPKSLQPFRSTSFPSPSKRVSLNSHLLDRKLRSTKNCDEPNLLPRAWR